MANRNGGNGFFAGLVIGGLVGAGIALLLAPQPGEKTRAQIRDTSLELKGRASEAIAEARETAEAITADARRRAEGITAEARKRAEEIVAEARKKAEEIQAPAPAGLKPGEKTGETSET
jgi:gas vesicle protein